MGPRGGNGPGTNVKIKDEQGNQKEQAFGERSNTAWTWRGAEVHKSKNIGVHASLIPTPYRKDYMENGGLECEWKASPRRA